mgnify:CR=1 FL=1
MNAKYRVTLWESERGWGRSPFMDIDFDSYEQALAKYNEVNAENTSAVAPDYYIYAAKPVLVDVDRNPPMK